MEGKELLGFSLCLSFWFDHQISIKRVSLFLGSLSSLKLVSKMEMETERSSSVSLRVIQQAKEELEMLEAQHPNRFRSLKLDLKSFIFLHSQNLFLNSNRNSNGSSSSPSSSQCPHHKLPSATSSSATTQASSNGSRKRKRGIFDDEESNQKFQRVDGDWVDGGRVDGDRVDVVLKRAKVCLQKIQDLKTNFFCS